jgi:hypothetical protein
MEVYIIYFYMLLFLSPLILGLIFMGGQKKIRVKHQQSGIEKHCCIGYSWTYLLFGFLVPVFRGEILIGVVHFVFSMVTFGIFQVIMSFLYNKQHTVRLLIDGWKLSDTEENNTHAKTKIGIA